MTFRFFIYCCAVAGGWAALVGWALGRVIAGPNPLGSSGLKGLCLGTLVALALALVDAWWNYTRGQLTATTFRILTGVLVGAVGGLLGGMVGQVLYGFRPVFYTLGWALTGLLVGISVGVFDVLARFVRQEDVRGARRKIRNGLLGGTVGGLVGGGLSLVLRDAWGGLFGNQPTEVLWSPSATGFVALGLCIGLMIGLAQVLFRESWIRVEKGFRAGRELILTKPEITIGRAEECDIGLFGDPGVDKTHARILRKGESYVLADLGSAGGTFLNDERLSEPTRLRSGDSIRVGQTVLTFGERQKQPK
jgi:hypothetical protein